MPQLNGWQRLWTVLMVLYGLVVGTVTVMTLPTYIYHPPTAGAVEEVVSRMPTKTWTGAKCEVSYRIELTDGRTWIAESNWFDLDAPENAKRRDLGAFERMDNAAFMKVLQRMSDAGESDDAIKSVARSYAAAQLVTVMVPLEGSSYSAVLCFSKSVPAAESERICKEYHEAYPKALKARRIRHGAVGFAVWLVPGVALYALGWSVGWIRRGFKKGAPPAVAATSVTTNPPVHPDSGSQ
jgi:hypothetical protein